MITIVLLITLSSGGTFDPNGAPRTTAAGDHRCTIDPNGYCAGSVTTAMGSDIDPNGNTAPRGQWPWQG